MEDAPEGRPFAGFGAGALDFLRELAARQSREWFRENREVYEREVRRPMGALIDGLTAAMARRGMPLRGDAEGSQFRLIRDVRFAKDRSPYKTHAGAVLTRDGTKASPGLLYLHVAPEGSFVAAGFYRPETPALAAIRGAIRDRAAEFARIEARLARDGLLLECEDPLKRLPRGFESLGDSAVAGALKLRSLIVRRPLAEPTLFDPALVGHVVDFAKAAFPLLRFGWSALDAAGGGPPAASGPSRRR